MSRAFVKEDIDVPERSAHRRSASGLPPGASNYMTAQGAENLRRRLSEMKKAGADREEILRLEESLRSATVVQPQARPDVVIFGVAVTLQSADGATRMHRIVGVDEVRLAPENVSWVSPLAKALLGASLNERVKLPPDDTTWWTVREIAS